MAEAVAGKRAWQAETVEAPALRAIVLRQVELGEADRMISLLTAERGREEARVPQARSSRKRFGGLDLFVLAEVRFDPRPSSGRLQEARVLRTHAGIGQDAVRLALAGRVAELLLQCAQEEQEGQDLFRLAEAALLALDREPGVDVGGHGWARAFELKLLHVLGCRPQLRRCAASGREPAVPPLSWSVACGGVLSSDMRERDPMARPIADDVVALLDRALHLPLSEQSSLTWSSRQAREAAVAMHDFVAENVGPRDRALRFLAQILPMVPLLCLAAGCPVSELPDEVRVQGYLFSTPDPVDASGEADLALAVPGADGTAWSDDGRLLGEAVVPYADHPEWYRFDALPPETAVHLVFGPPPDHGTDAAYVATVLSGRTAGDDLYVDPGAFHIWPLASAQGWVEGWFGAVPGSPIARPTFDPELAGEGGMAIGRIAGAEDREGLRVVFRDGAGFDREAWYTDPEGAPALGTGISRDGGFAVFGLSAGPVEVLLFDADGEGHGGAFVTRIEEDGVTSLFGFEVLG